jgi:hypothetical protein
MIRVFMETFLDFFLSSVLNVFKAVWNSPHSAENYSNMVSVVFLLFTIVFITTFVVMSCKNFSRLHDDDVKKKFGAIFEGTNLDAPTIS